MVTIQNCTNETAKTFNRACERTEIFTIFVAICTKSETIFATNVYFAQKQQIIWKEKAQKRKNVIWIIVC